MIFSSHYKPYNLCTSHYNQPFKTIPLSCVYLIIPFHFLIFFPCDLFWELTSGVYISHSPVIPSEFLGGCLQHCIAKFLLWQTYLRTALPPVGLPDTLGLLKTLPRQRPLKLAMLSAHWGDCRRQMMSKHPFALYPWNSSPGDSPAGPSS
jgi:hypothetical protein